MSRFRTPMAGLAGLALLFLGAAVPAAADPTERAEDLAVVTLLNINDFHGRIASAPDSDSGANTLSLAAVIDRLRQSAGPANAVLLSAGDNVGASLFASAVQDDQPTLDVLNTLGLAASAVGNHEFDRGWDDLSGRLEEAADFPYLGANVYAKGTKNPALQEFAVVEAAGLRVAVIGAVTQETPTLVSPAGVAAIDFGDPVEAVNRVADRIKAENLADIIVAEYHDGAPAGSPEGATLEQEIAVSATFAHIVEDTAASVDVIFTAHTHKAYAWEAAVPGTDKTRPVLQTGCYGANLGVVSLSYDKTAGTVVSHSQTNVKAAATEPDPNDPAAQLPVPTEAETAASPTLTRVKAIVDAAMANAQAVGSQKVGAVTADITRAAAGGTYSADGVYSGGALDDRAEAS
ncbi:MAG: metallophosphoesterase, partial [Propionibacteriaceae bacterium]|nr:metallophosphoesterase [Propionibacteriaceae bacterium]